MCFAFSRLQVHSGSHPGNSVVNPLPPCVLCWMKVKVKLLSRFRLFATPWTIAYQAPPSVEFSRQEYWSGLPFPSPGDLPNTGIEPGSPALQAGALPSAPSGKMLGHNQSLLISLRSRHVFCLHFLDSACMR